MPHIPTSRLNDGRDLAKQLTYAAGRIAMYRGTKLHRPKCYGRGLRMISKQLAVLCVIQEGIASSEALRWLMAYLDSEIAEFHKQQESRWFPKRCQQLIPVANDFHRCLSSWQSLDIADFQRLHRSAVAVLGAAKVKRIKLLIEDFRLVLKGPSPSLSNPLKRDDG